MYDEELRIIDDEMTIGINGVISSHLLYTYYQNQALIDLHRSKNQYSVGVGKCYTSIDLATERGESVGTWGGGYGT